MGAILEILLSLFPTLRPCPDISRKNLMNPNNRFPSSIWELGNHRRLTCSLGSCNRSWESWVSASKFSLCVLHFSCSFCFNLTNPNSIWVHDIKTRNWVHKTNFARFFHCFMSGSSSENKFTSEC